MSWSDRKDTRKGDTMPPAAAELLRAAWPLILVQWPESERIFGTSDLAALVGVIEGKVDVTLVDRAIMVTQLRSSESMRLFPDELVDTVARAAVADGFWVLLTLPGFAAASFMRRKRVNAPGGTA